MKQQLGVIKLEVRGLELETRQWEEASVAQACSINHQKLTKNKNRLKILQIPNKDHNQQKDDQLIQTQTARSSNRI